MQKNDSSYINVNIEKKRKENRLRPMRMIKQKLGLEIAIYLRHLL